MSEQSYPLIISFDVETTGLYHDRCHIIELGSVKVDHTGTKIDTFSRFANPGYSIPKNITDLTGITNEMVKDADPSSKVIKDWFSWLEPGAILLAHNASFDSKFVTKPMVDENIDFENYCVVDTLDWARCVFHNLPKHKLGVLLEHINYNCENLHRAHDDALGAMHLAAYMIRNKKPTNKDEFYKLLLDRAKRIKDYLPKPKVEPSFNF